MVLQVGDALAHVAGIEASQGDEDLVAGVDAGEIERAGEAPVHLLVHKRDMVKLMPEDEADLLSHVGLGRYPPEAVAGGGELRHTFLRLEATPLPHRIRPERDLEHVEHAPLLACELLPHEPLCMIERIEQEADPSPRIDLAEAAECLREVLLILFLEIRGDARPDAEPREGGHTVDVADIEMMEGEEDFERERPARLLLKACHRRDERLLRADGSTDVLEHIALGDLLELYRAALRNGREALLDLASQAFASRLEQRLELGCEVISPVLLAYEVEHRQALLARSQAQTSSQLLEEDGERLRRTQEEHRVDLGDIDTLVVDIDGKDELEPAVLQIIAGLPSCFLIRIGTDRFGLDACLAEPLCHETGMGFADAEAKPPHMADVCDIAPCRIDNEIGAPAGNPLIEHIDILEICLRIAAPLPPQALEAHLVGHAEVAEGTEELPVDGFRETDLGCDPAIEIGQDGLPIGTLRRRGEPQEDLWLEAGEDLLVGACGSMVDLVHDDVFEVGGIEALPELLGLERLDRDEKMRRCRLGPLPSDHEGTEVLVLQDTAEAGQRLAQDLLAVRDEEQARSPPLPLAEAPVVEGSNHGLARACRCHDQVPPMPSHLTFGSEGIEDLLLVRIGTDIEGIDLPLPFLLVPAPLVADGLCEALLILLSIVLEFGIVPVGIEGRADLVEDVLLVGTAHLHIPFEPACHRWIREVGGAHIGSRIAAPPPEDIGLRMEAGPSCIVGDLDGSTGKPGELGHCLGVGRPHIACRNDPEPAATLGKAPELAHKETDTAPFHK